VDAEGNEVGKVTSGGFSPTLERPIAMAYVPAASAEPGTQVTLAQRGKIFQAKVVPMPFVPHRYQRKGAAAMSLYFTKEHEWIRLEGETATVGITDLPRRSSATSSSSKCRGGAPGDPGRRCGRRRVREGGLRRLCAGER
jgi:hypothetical protein